MSRMKSIKEVWQSVSHGVNTMVYVFILFVLFLWVFILMGMNLYENKDWIVQRGSTAKFKNFSWGFSLIFQIFTLDNWYIFMNQLNEELEINAINVGYTASVVLMLAIIFKNVVAAIIVNEHTTKVAIERYERDEAEIQERLAAAKHNFIAGAGIPEPDRRKSVSVRTTLNKNRDSVFDRKTKLLRDLDFEQQSHFNWIGK